MTGLHARGEELFSELWNGLQEIEGVTCYGPPPGRPRTPTVSFTVKGVPSSQVAKALAQEGLFVSNGNFYATTVLERLGQTRDGLVRIGCACYTTAQEIKRLLDAVRSVRA
jgi:selenocysteine lyase/cysteine desulfurase